MSQVPLTHIGSPARLAALRQLGLLDTPANPAFDRMTRLAARMLHAPVALVTFVEEERQFFKSAVGLQEPWATRRETPRSHSFCQYVVEQGEPLIVADARTHPLLYDNPAILEMGVVAYAGIPLITRDGQRLGSFCVIDHQPRIWTEDEIDTLRDLAASVITEIELLADTIERTQAETTAQRLAEQRKQLLEVAHTVVSSLALQDILPQLQRTLRLVVAHDALSVYWLDAAAGLLRPAHQVGPAWLGEQADTWPIPIGSGLAGAVALSGRAEMVNNAQRDPRSIFPPGTAETPEHHQITLPLQAHAQIRGVFLISRTNSEPFTEQEFELAQIFMSFASLAIENARLFERTKLAEERQRLLLEQIPCRLWTTDRDLRYTSLVGLVAHELRPQPNSMIGMSIYEFFGTQDPQLPPIAAHLRALAGEPSAYELERHGRVFQTHIQPFRDSQGQVAGCIGVALDITERRRVEEALRAEFGFRTAIIERAAEGLCVCHAIDEYPYIAFTVWNDRMIDITGYTIDEINRRGWYQTVYAEPDQQARAQARMEQMREGDDLIAEEWEITCADGQKRVAAISTSVLASGDGTKHVLALLHDITERKQAEMALAEREAMLRSIGDNLPNGMIFQVVQSAADQIQFTYVSEGAARATNATPEQIYADPTLILNRIVEEDQERYWAAEAASFRDLSIFDIEIRMRSPSGGIEWRHIRSQPRYLSDGRLAWDGFSIDITERKRVEDALRESEERARRLSEVAFEGITIHDQGMIIDANQALANILGYEHTEIIGMHVLNFAAPESHDLIMTNFRTGAAQPYEVVGLRKDGTRITAEIQAKPILYQGKSLRVTAIRDITARKQAEAALRESEDRYRAFFEYSIDAILLTAPDGSIFAANPAACRIFGRSEAEICQAGRNGLIDTNDPRLPAALEQRARTGSFKGELTYLRQDGTRFPGELSTALFRDRNGLIKTSMIIRDITERKRAEQEREQLIEALQEALANIKTLRGLLPICASCKKIRDDSGYWSQIEAYVQAHSDAVFSHGICPDCAKRLYGDIFEE
jgi:PAS domain S-box-containing protein